MNVVCYERGLLWTGLFWKGTKFDTKHVMIFENDIHWYMYKYFWIRADDAYFVGEIYTL